MISDKTTMNTFSIFHIYQSIAQYKHPLRLHLLLKPM